MRILKTNSERKAFAITSAIFALMLLLFFLYKMTLPQLNEILLGGEIAISFGNSEQGKGKIQPKEMVESAPEAILVQEIVEVESKPVVVQKTTEAPIIKTSEVTKPKQDNAKIKLEPKIDPKPSQSTTDALSSLINGPKQSGVKSEGQGNSNQDGDQGKLSGDIYSNSAYGDGKGIGGSGGGTSWGLNGRMLASSGKVVPDCNEVGTVVIEIRVNRNGEVVEARPTKGTTNSAACLTDAATATAKKFKWRKDDNAPTIQIGFIVINFRVGA